MAVNGKQVVAESGVKYSLGSPWEQVGAGQSKFDVLDLMSGKAVLASVSGTPPLSPKAATVFFFGAAGSDGGLQAQLVSDAPESTVAVAV